MTRRLLTGLAALGAEKHGAVKVAGSGNHRGGAVVSAVKAMKTLSDNLVKLLEKYKPANDDAAETELRPLFNSLKNAFEEHLG